MEKWKNGGMENNKIKDEEQIDVEEEDEEKWMNAEKIKKFWKIVNRRRKSEKKKNMSDKRMKKEWVMKKLKWCSILKRNYVLVICEELCYSQSLKF